MRLMSKLIAIAGVIAVAALVTIGYVRASPPTPFQLPAESDYDSGYVSSTAITGSITTYRAAAIAASIDNEGAATNAVSIYCYDASLAGTTAGPFTVQVPPNTVQVVQMDPAFLGTNVTPNVWTIPMDPCPDIAKAVVAAQSGAIRRLVMRAY